MQTYLDALINRFGIPSLRQRDFNVMYIHCHHLALVNLNVIRVGDNSEGIP